MYKPLEFIKETANSSNIYEEQLKTLINAGFSFPRAMTEDDFLTYTMSPFFLAGYHSKEMQEVAKDVDPLYLKYKNLDIELLECKELMDMAVSGRKDVAFQSIITEYRDFLALGVVLDRWGRNKQVYQIDEDFAKALLCTENLKISREVFEHLPTDTFYIDLSKCKAFYPSLGAWIHIHSYQGCVSIATYVFTDVIDGSNNQNLVFSVYDSGFYNPDGLVVVRKDDLEEGVPFFNYIKQGFSHF